MAIVVPSVTAYEPHEYREQVEQVSGFARRLHLDFMDGVFTSKRSPELNQFWWPRKIPVDLHLMCKRPMDYIDIVETLEPQQVIVHAEAEGNFIEWADRLHHMVGIKVGVALLQQTEPELIKDELARIDYVLVFSGDLGNFGGKADLQYLNKVKKLKGWKPELEIGWDGGINEWNIGLLVDGGVGVLNVGGAIQKAKDPKAAYGTLVALAENKDVAKIDA